VRKRQGTLGASMARRGTMGLEMGLQLSVCGWVREREREREPCIGFSRLFSAEPYGLQDDDERDEERENTRRKKK
jgi:hypothetical protein